MHHVIRLHAAAPAKPATGQPCNGCGVCCASEPCPIGTLASRRTTGACDALAWNAAEARYRCGLVDQPRAHLPAPLHRIAPLMAKIARRYIAAGSGCDCSADVLYGAHDASPVDAEAATAPHTACPAIGARALTRRNPRPE
jgi:hypothetical protein